MLVRFSKTVLFFVLCTLIVACGREDDLQVPGEQTQIIQEFCLEGSPYQVPNVFSTLAFSGIPYTFDYTTFEYQFTVNHLTDLTLNTLRQTDQFFKPNLLSELITPDDEGKTVLTEAQIARIDASDVELSNVTASVSYEYEGQARIADLDEGFLSHEIFLQPGVNEITVDVDVSFLTDYSGVECGLSEPLRALIAEYDAGVINDETEEAIAEMESRSFTANHTLSYVFTISRDSAEEVEVADIGNLLNLYDVDSIDGANVSIQGDYLIVGAPLEDSNSTGVFTSLEVQNDLDGSIKNTQAQDSGAVYIYERNAAGNWSFEWMIKAANAENGDRFGASVSIDDDWLVIAAPGEDSSAQSVFSNYDSDNQFSEDLQQTLINAGSDNLAPNSGAIYLYQLQTDGSWEFYSYIKPERNIRGDNGFDMAFGHQIDIKEIIDDTFGNLGYRIIVSAPEEDSSNVSANDIGSIDSGIVFYYRILDEGGFSAEYQGLIKAPLPQAGDRFGDSIDQTGDGYLFVGAPFENSASRSIIGPEELGAYVPDLNRTNSGAVYVYEPRTVALVSVLKASNADNNDLFGGKVSAYGNYVAVAASKEDSDSVGFNRDMSSNNGTDSGAVYIFKRDAQSDLFSQDAYIKSPVNELFSEFGNDLAMDDNNLVVAHARAENNGQSDAGKLYLYTRENETQEWFLSFSSVLEGATEFASRVGLDAETIVSTSTESNKPLAVLR